MAIARGTFGTYAITSTGHAFPSDEEAVEQALEYMLSMCGNPGQERLIGDLSQEFYDWAIYALEDESAYGTVWGDFAAMVIYEWYEGRTDKWLGTDDIWSEGWIMIAEQSGYHDAYDEVGEGTGQEFG